MPTFSHRRRCARAMRITIGRMNPALAAFLFIIAATCGLQLGKVSALAAQTNPTGNDSWSGSISVPAQLESDANAWSAYPLSARLLKPEPSGVTRFFPQDTSIRARGWVDAGYTYNTSSPTSHFNGPYNAIDRNIPQLNQLYLILDRPLQPGGAWSIGGRVDVLYGYDFFLAQSNGLERRANGTPHWNQNHYGLAIPQAYAEIGNDKVSLKIGHFYTIIGYEEVPATNNFFYSKSYSYQFAGPFTHWGGLATWNATDRITVQGGVVNGWDAVDRTKDRPTGLAKVKYTAPDNFWSAALAIATGDEPTANPDQFATRTRYSAIVTLQPTERIEYVFHQHYAYQEDGRLNGGIARWYGIENYLYYKITDQWKAGLRLEWMRDEAGTRVGGSPFRGNPNQAPFPGSFYSVSAGVNYRPRPNLLLRPEIRSDWHDGQRSPYNDGLNKNQVLLAINANLQF